MVYTKQIYPAKVQPLGAANGYPASGFFAMHITYPDTEYSDAVSDWTYGANASSVWKQGVTIIIRTPLAVAAAPSEVDNVIVVDLKSPITQAANLGTEKAARIIAAKINSRRVKQTGERGKTRYLRARYVRMSGKPSYTGDAMIAGPADSSALGLTQAQTLRVKFDGGYRNGFPSDLPTSGTITYNDNDHTNLSLSYSAITGSRYGPKRFTSSASGQESIADFTITGGTLASLIDQVGDPNDGYPHQLDDSGSATFSIAGEPEKHTVVLSWEATTPQTAGGYWAAANGGPVIQGLGASVPVWYFTAKPMDGGNMGLPAPNYDSRGSTAAAHSTGHGYVRFSIEGLNSCDLPDMPPPDYNVSNPSISGITKGDFATVGSGNTGTVKMAELEYGTTLPVSAGDIFSLKSGYQAKVTNASTNMVTSSRDELTDMTYDITGGTLFRTKGIEGTGSIQYPRPIFSAKSVNSDRVNGLRISNEHMVFEDITTTDDQGNVLTLKGGSPLGVVIKDFAVQNVREDMSTGNEVTGPSAPDGKLTPNLQIQLPDPAEIPGEIFVRSGHDRVQAWSNMTWGLGGLTAPDPRPAGVAEASGGVSQFDTHDRMLVFHCKRLLHSDLTAKHGLTPPTTAGAVPSGSTRLYSAHRITDHAERGSVLKQTTNGTATGYPFPHHRIRFARQGHSFVTPLTHRGTPHAMRRQLHRSHGSAYSLLFEAETEHKHFGFGSGKASNSATIFELDTLEVKGESGFRATGSFSSEGLPLTEMDGFRLPDIKTTYSGVTPKTNFDYLIAPGQEHTETIGVGHLVRRGAFSEDSGRNVGGPTRLTFDAALPTLNSPRRYNAGSEFMVNGFILGDYAMGGGRPIPCIIRKGASSAFVSGLEEGVIAPRVGTELATVPPLLCHDPEYLNMAARTPNAAGISSSYGDYALLDKSNTGTGATPDAFLCTWLAEYSHPALLGTVREHFMTFRYREAGMPRSLDYPPTKGLYLRNHSNPTTTGEAVNAEPFERLYVLQWLQNYGYNGLNAGGHGTIEGLKSANSVLMGHTTVREASGTLRIPTTYQLGRVSRGEGMGDGINPEKTMGVSNYDVDSDSVVFTKHMSVMDPMVAYDVSRRLPVRAWGFRTGSDALDMLAGDPTESGSQDPIYGRARFDGGIHDSVQKIPHSSSPYGASWTFPSAYNGVERSVPIGMVLTSHTAEATPFSSVVRGTNAKPISSEQPLGFGLTLGIESFGLVKPTALPAGGWEAKIDSNAASTVPLTGIPMNKGSDPFIDLTQYTGSSAYAQANAKSAVSSTQYGIGGGFHHLRGNALHTNASAVDHSSSNVHYPTTGWGIGTHSNATIRTLTPIPLSEIADHRQVQSRTEPRLGLVIQTENERNTNKNTEYAVTSTKAVSLSSDLILGQHFPVLPSWSVKSYFATHSMTIDPSATIPTHSISQATAHTLPTWSPDTNAAKGGTDPAAPLVRPKTSAKDAWSVRGSADLPPWGGTYILRKTYLNRTEAGSLSTEIHATNGNAATSAPRRKAVDYFVRPMRPLKLFGFASDLLQDGWVLGARSSVGEATLEYQTFTRDNRYGVFESDLEQTLGKPQFITSSQGAFEITYPDMNEHDVVYHLLPSASMLQFFKSDAVRKTIDGQFNPEVEPRYSQTTHPGGGEMIHQTETRYRSDGLGTSGDFAKQTTPEGGSYTQMDTAMRLYPQFKVLSNSGSGGSGTVFLEDASLLPSSGRLFLIGGINLTYTGKTKNKLTGVTISAGVPDLSGEILRYSTESSPTTLADMRPLTLPHLVPPTFIDNSLTLAKQESSIWNRYDVSSGKVRQTSLSYRGLLEYDPTDFLMVSQRPVIIENGKTTARIKNASTSLTTLRFDGDEITSTNFPPYLFDSTGFTLRIAGVEKDELSTTLLFRNIEGNSIVEAGLTEGPVLMGQKGFVGVRTSDAVLTLLNDAGTDIAGYNVTPTSALLAKDKEIAATLDAHPSLRVVSDHSPIFSARKTRGLNIMELIRNMSQMDGKQLVNERNGALVYSSNAFTNRGSRLGLASAIQKIKVSKMYDSPNEVVVVGDPMAANERVFVVVKDFDRMKKEANKGAKSNLVKTLRQEIPGLKTNSEALKLAKSILSRVENSVPLVKMRGAFKSSSIQPGEIVALDLPAHGLWGDYAVFEAKHNYTSLTSDFVVAQYDKGIEGILSDLQAVSGNTTPLDENAGKTVDVAEVSMSSGIRVVAVHKVFIRNVSNQGFIIGAKHSQGMGKIGVRDSNKRARAIGTSKSKFYEVK